MSNIEYWNAYPHPRADDGVGHKAALITGRRLDAMTKLVRKSDYDTLAERLAGAAEALEEMAAHTFERWEDSDRWYRERARSVLAVLRGSSDV
jgi:hypothetical protein